MRGAAWGSTLATSTSAPARPCTTTSCPSGSTISTCTRHARGRTARRRPRTADVLRPHADDHAGAVTAARRGAQRLRHRQRERGGFQRAAAVAHRRGEEVHRRRADEAGDEQVGRPLVALERRSQLPEVAVLHHRDAVTHRHRLDLVVGDVDGRRTEALLELRDLGAHLHPQLGVEVGERLVEEEHRRLADDRPTDRDPLPLAAGELARLALEQVGDVEDLRRLGDEPFDLGGRRLADAQAEVDVLAHRHVGVERVVLEHHRDVAVLRRQVVDDPAADRDRAAGDLLEAGHHPQRRRLAAARRTHQHHELVVADLEIELPDDGHVAVSLRDAVEDDRCHPCPPLLLRVARARKSSSQPDPARRVAITVPARRRSRRALPRRAAAGAACRGWRRAARRCSRRSAPR